LFLCLLWFVCPVVFAVVFTIIIHVVGCAGGMLAGSDGISGGCGGRSVGVCVCFVAAAACFVCSFLFVKRKERLFVLLFEWALYLAALRLL
jgi:hypothetical protein